jgi:hypothetical protein
MEPTLKAILARFKGNKAAAAVYCRNMAHDYPKLRDEYIAYAL